MADMHTCTEKETAGPVTIPHVGGPIIATTAVTVLIDFMPAAVVGDMAVCVGKPDSLTEGASTVLIGGAAPARVGDSTDHGGTIVLGSSTVFIGQSGQGAALSAAASAGSAFCEVCEGGS